MALRHEWDALVSETTDLPFYRHGFFRVWLDNFAPRGRLRVLLGRDEAGALVAALPLLRVRGSMFGLPVRRLVSAANDHSCRFDLIARDAPAAAHAFFQHLSAGKDWDVFCLIDVPKGGNAWRLYGEAKAARYPTGTWQSLISPYVPLSGTYSALQGRLSPSFKANLRRRSKKLRERGHVTLERVAGGPELAERLQEGYALEASGWKGKAGTAIAQRPATLGFYSDLAHEAAHNGDLSLYFLRLDNELVAFHYGLTHNHTYYLLKTAYNEAYKEFRAGQLLMHEVLQDCISRGLSEFDFLGPDMPWKREWAACARSHKWLFIFRDAPYGRLLRYAKFPWSQTARRLLKRETRNARNEK